MLDADRGSLLTVRLHYPAEVKSVAQHLQKAVAVATISGVTFEIQCQASQERSFAKEHDLLSADQIHKPPKVREIRDIIVIWQKQQKDQESVCTNTKYPKCDVGFALS